MDKSKFVAEYLSYDLLSQSDSFDVNRTANLFDRQLCLLVDKYCPLKAKCVSSRTSSSRHWYTEDLRLLKRRKRKLEREWVKCKCY